MGSKTMKNMIILRDLPSNMVEEAYIVFKNNAKIHKLEKIERKKTEEDKKETESKEYMVREAEMIVSDYISKIEKKEYELGNGNKKLKEKYKRLKVMAIFLTVFSILSVIRILLK